MASWIGMIPIVPSTRGCGNASTQAQAKPAISPPKWLYFGEKSCHCRQNASIPARRRWSLET
jgi:hypothetical protein